LKPEGESLLKKVGLASLIPIGFVGFVLLIILLVRGMVWASAKLLPWLINASTIALAICVFVLLPLWVFRKTRTWAGRGFYTASFLFGAMLFTYSCIAAVEIWGYVALAIGLVLPGLAWCPLHFWRRCRTRRSVLWNVALGIVLTFGTRLLGIWLSNSPQEQIPSLEDASRVETWQ